MRSRSLLGGQDPRRKREIEGRMFRNRHGLFARQTEYAPLIGYARPAIAAFTCDQHRIRHGIIGPCLACSTRVGVTRGGTANATAKCCLTSRRGARINFEMTPRLDGYRNHICSSRRGRSCDRAWRCPSRSCFSSP